jgi:hypothetical protein
MKKIDLSDIDITSADELESLSIGQIVSVDGDAGMISAVLESEFNWPGDTSAVDESEDRVQEVKSDEGDIVMQASAEEPLYVVALQKGGSIVAEGDEISTDASLDRDGKEIDSWQDMDEENVDDAELATLYGQCENPCELDEWREAKATRVRERNAEAIAEYVEGNDTSLEELAQYSPEELLNIPGVDDPEVGFASDPNGWDRTSYLDAWASVGGTWSTCYPRMVRHFGPNMAKRWCAALKDEVLGTEEWRNSF